MPHMIDCCCIVKSSSLQVRAQFDRELSSQCKALMWLRLITRSSVSSFYCVSSLTHLGLLLRRQAITESGCGMQLKKFTRTCLIAAFTLTQFICSQVRHPEFPLLPSAKLPIAVVCAAAVAAPVAVAAAVAAAAVAAAVAAANTFCIQSTVDIKGGHQGSG